MRRRIEELFGRGIVVGEYGFLLKNEVRDFEGRGGGGNEVEGNKGGLWSMRGRMILKDKEGVMSVG
ncbi:gamma-glutamyltransferase [Bacillus sp. WP8]|uniref:gamma-glutamyltransferase n=1 Tax=Bacillus sp. WP8 TaxID=756828 RepID=UPI0011A23FE5|nr:gamma-glutamyltransferase [Bacillus sp. WP8]